MRKGRPVEIYTLSDPRTDRTRYVGYSFDAVIRLRKHMNLYHPHTHKTRWLRQLKDLGLLPTLKVRFTVPTVKLAKRAEISLIKALRQRGFDLTNSTNGGDGTVGRKGFVGPWRGKKLSAEHRANVSKAMKGRTFSEEHCRNLKLSNVQRGQKQPVGQQAKMQAGRALSILINPEKYRAARRLVMTKEIREQISLKLRGRPWSAARRKSQDERKLRLSAAQISSVVITTSSN